MAIKLNVDNYYSKTKVFFEFIKQLKIFSHKILQIGKSTLRLTDFFVFSFEKH